jgi:hypothetical protein
VTVIASVALLFCTSDRSSVSKADWLQACAIKLETARVRLAAQSPLFADAKVEVAGGRVTLRVGMEASSTMRAEPAAGAEGYFVEVRERPPREPHVESADSPNVAVDLWVDLPIIDKTWTPDKLRRYRHNGRLEGVLRASRNDDSQRAPPVPAWLANFVRIFQTGIESCLAR